MSSARSRIRVLILIKGLGIGGAESLIAESCSLWDRESFDYKVAYLLPWKDQLVPSIARHGIEVVDLSWTKPWNIAAISRLRSLSRAWRPHIVHSHLPAAGVIARTTLSTPHVYTEHNVAESYRQPTRTLNRITYARNDAVAAVSDAVKQSLAGYPGPTPQVIPNGVSVQVEAGAPERVRAELRIGKHAALVVHVGNIRPHKGHSNLIAATAKLAKQPDEIRVVSVGGEKHDGDLERLRAEAKSSGVQEMISFVGRREDARDFLAAADVVVNPSDFEGLPVSLLEALALSRPVVATEVGGVPTVVRHEKTGLLVPPRDSSALAAAIIRALNSEEAKEWGVNGARLIASDYGLDRMVIAYEDLYRSVADG